MLLDLRPLFGVAASTGGSTGAPVVVGSRPSGDDIYAYRLKHLSAVQDEEATLALYASDAIDYETLLRLLRKLN